MSFLEETSIRNIDRGTLKDTLLQIFLLSDSSKYVAQKRLDKILNMSGNRYKSATDNGDESEVSRSAYVMLTTNQAMRLTNNFINAKFSKIQEIITLMIILMNNGYLKDKYEMLNIRDDIYAYDEVKLKDLITKYYDNASKELNELYAQFTELYPEVTKDGSYELEGKVIEVDAKNLAYFINNEPSNISQYIHRIITPGDRADEAHKFVINKLRVKSSELNCPKQQFLFDYFHFNEGKFKRNRDKIYKILDNSLSIESYNQILADHYKMEVGVKE